MARETRSRSWAVEAPARGWVVGDSEDGGTGSKR